MVLGALLIIGAIALTYWNQKEDNTAKNSVAEIMPRLVQQIQDKINGENVDLDVIPELQKPVELLTEEDKKMTEVEIDGNLYIGYLSIPALNMELPIMSTWSYAQLKIAPCRFSGSIKGEDLVLMAHNYTSHFGTLSQLTLDSLVTFTDMDGEVTSYEVVGIDILDPSAVEEMTAGVFDLTLFTCTYGGQNRVTVYCNRITES